jgi:hypothetical protein
MRACILPQVRGQFYGCHRHRLDSWPRNRCIASLPKPTCPLCRTRFEPWDIRKLHIDLGHCTSSVPYLVATKALRPSSGNVVDTAMEGPLVWSPPLSVPRLSTSLPTVSPPSLSCTPLLCYVISFSCCGFRTLTDAERNRFDLIIHFSALFVFILFSLHVAGVPLLDPAPHLL